MTAEVWGFLAAELNPPALLSIMASSAMPSPLHACLCQFIPLSDLHHTSCSHSWLLLQHRLPSCLHSGGYAWGAWMATCLQLKPPEHKVQVHQSPLHHLVLSCHLLSHRHRARASTASPACPAQQAMHPSGALDPSYNNAAYFLACSSFSGKDNQFPPSLWA